VEAKCDRDGTPYSVCGVPESVPLLKVVFFLKIEINSFDTCCNSSVYGVPRSVPLLNVVIASNTPRALDFQTAIYYFSQNQIIVLTHAANSGYILKLNT